MAGTVDYLHKVVVEVGEDCLVHRVLILVGRGDVHGVHRVHVLVGRVGIHGVHH